MRRILKLISLPMLMVMGLGSHLHAQTTYCVPTWTGWAINEPTQPITLVQFGTGTGAINNPSSEIVSASTPRYEDYSSISMDVHRDSTYTLVVKGNTNGNATNYITIYIDWNGDGVFSNSLSQNEKYQYTSAIINSTGLDTAKMTTTITVPSDAVLGSTRMRIVKNYQSPSPAPCANPFIFGQVEDYTLVIVDNALVYSVSVSTQNNVSPSITNANGTLQLNAVVNPSATANQNVTWSIDAGASLGTVSATGLVTANANNGTMIIRATSTQDATKYGTIAVNLAVPQTPATLTYIDSFENTSDWTFVNHTANSPTAWVIGNAVNNGGSKSLYVSTDNGLTNTIDASVVSTVHAYRDIIVPNGTTNATLSFDWKAVGDYYNGGWGYQVYNFMQAWIVPNSYTPTGGNLVSGVANAIQLQGPHQNGNFLEQGTFITFTNANVDLSAFAGDTVRLIFTWKTLNGTTGTPAAIDNIYLGIPQAVAADSVVITTANNVAPTITSLYGTLQLNAAVWPATFSQNVTWSNTSGAAFATVDANGLVTGLSNGTATIRATSAVSTSVYDEIQIVVNIPAAPVETCDTLTTFNYDFENFTTFPENCWTGSQAYPMISLGNANGNKFVQVYSATNAGQDIFVVSPPVSTIDGQHNLTFDATAAGTDLTVTFGTIASKEDYNSFVATGAAFTPVAGQTYTSSNLTATAGHYHVVIKVTPNGVHKVLGIDNVEWKLDDNNVSVNELELANAIAVYPNPTSNVINIDSKVNLASIELYNVLGQLIHTSKAQQINVSHLNSGVYFVKVISEKGHTKTFRVVKQ